MMQRVTLRNVADHAGVSVTTVSNVVRGWPHISDATRSKVQDAIRELGYSPHPIAQGLRTGRTHVIGFIVPDLANIHFSAMVSIVEDVAHDHGYSLMVFNTHDDAEREALCIHQVTSRWMDGLLIVQAARARNTAQLLKSITIPIIAIDRVPDHFDGSCYYVNNRTIVSLVMEHLIALGHRSIAFLPGPQGAITARDRSRAYAEITQQMSLDYHPTPENQGRWDASEGYQQTRWLLDRGEHPTAIFASNDMMAVGAAHAIYDCGLSIPGDISLVGVDDTEVSRHMTPPLTTVRQPLDQIAHAGIESLLGFINHQENENAEPLQPVRMSFEPELVVRESTAPLIR